MNGGKDGIMHEQSSGVIEVEKLGGKVLKVSCRYDRRSGEDGFGKEGGKEKKEEDGG